MIAFISGAPVDERIGVVRFTVSNEPLDPCAYGREPEGKGVSFTRCAMAAANVYRLAWTQFDTFVERMPIVLLEVSQFRPRGVPAKVTAFFQGLYGGEFAPASMSVSDVPYRAWLLERLQPVRGGSLTCPDGLYLFLGGRAASFHDGYNLASSLVEIAAFLVTNSRVQHESSLLAQEVLDLFAPLAAEFIRRRPTKPRIAEAAQSAEHKARKILCVSLQATDSEIDKAWRRLRGEYAPDKVQHVSEAFFRLAHEKVHEIDKAYEVLRRTRSLRTGTR